MNKLSKLILTSAVVFSISACGPTSEPSGDNSIESPTTSMSNEEKVVVKFVNTDMPNVELNKGDKLQKPSEPSKADHIFGGWYYESTFENEVEFPIVVNSDISIYAKFNTYEEAFIEARNKTVGADAKGFTYNYQTNAVAAYSSFNLNGTTNGKSQYAPDRKVSFYENHENSGVLFVDGTKHQFNEDSLLTHISFNEDGELTKYETEYADENYRYDSSSFAKALFELDDEQIKSVEETSTKGLYKLNTTILFSNILSTVLNYLNHPIVEALLVSLPETSASTNMYVSFTDGYVKSYRYEMIINVTAIQFTLSYDLNFVDYTSKEISLPKFEGLAVGSEALSSKTDSVNTMASNYRKDTNSSYDFKVKTGIDFDGANSIDATFAGNTKRKVETNNVYFRNDIEIDTDLKNADLYKESGLKDIHIIKAKLADNSVYIREKKTLKDATHESSATALDDYYVFDILDFVSDATCVQTKKKDTITNENFVFTASSLKNIITWFNNSLDVDPTNVATNEIKVLGTINFDTLVVNESTFIVSVENGKIVDVEFELDAEAQVKYENSRDFSNYALANISITLSLEVTDDGADYEPATSAKDI